jgi:integrase
LGFDRARASELLGATVGDVDPGQQLITLIRKGTRAMQPLPAAPDAFVWLRLHQMQLAGVSPAGRDQPLWWTLREPLRPLRYDPARAMFNRANAILLANWSLHDLRHTAAYRMARDPQMPLTPLRQVPIVTRYFAFGSTLETLVDAKARGQPWRVIGTREIH